MEAKAYLGLRHMRWNCKYHFVLLVGLDWKVI